MIRSHLCKRILTMYSCIFIGSFVCYGQNNIGINDSDFMYGFSGKLIWDLPLSKEKGNLRVSLAAGAGYSIYETNLTSVNIELTTAFGGLGSYQNENITYWVIAPHITQSFGKGYENSIDRNQPLYYFTDLVAPPLQNPYQNTASVGINCVNFINGKMKGAWQRVAHLGFKFNKVHIVYNNDGGTLLKWWGDKKDRYFTGSGFANIHLDSHIAVNHIGLNFYKFTGYSEMAFELSNELLSASVDYKNPNQNFLNFGFWSINIGNTNHGDFSFRYNNPINIREVQNLIHYSLGFGYHQNFGKPYYSMAFSPSIFQTKLPAK